MTQNLLMLKLAEGDLSTTIVVPRFSGFFLEALVSGLRFICMSYMR